MLPMPDSVWQETLLVWQAVHLRVHSKTSLFIPYQTNLLDISLAVALPDGWESPWMISNTNLRLNEGTTVRGLPVLLSHRSDNSESSIGMSSSCKAVEEVLRSFVAGSISCFARSS